MNVKEYNEGPYRETKHAESFILCLPHAIEKAGGDALHQLLCIGWGDEVKQTILTAVRQYRKSCLKAVKLQQRFSTEDLSGAFDVNSIVLSDNLTAEEASQFIWLLRKARGQNQEDI